MGHLRPFMRQKTHVRYDRSQGRADVRDWANGGEIRKRGQRFAHCIVFIAARSDDGGDSVRLEAGKPDDLRPVLSVSETTSVRAPFRSWTSEPKTLACPKQGSKAKDREDGGGDAVD